jgi:hypothetical protein
MFARRWSTGTLVGAVAFAVLTGFFGGQLWPSFRPSVDTCEKSDPRTAAGNAANAAVHPTADFSGNFPATEDFESACQELLTRTATPALNDQLSAVMEKLAGQNPLRAIALARTATNLRLRSQLLDAAFCGWGKADPNAAADWILAQPAETLDANTAIASVLKGAVQNSANAIQLTERLNQQNPESAREHGDALIYALTQNGNFQDAADFAARESGPLRTEWLAAAYTSWANYQPQTAALNALRLEDADARTDALNAVISGWGQVDPPGLAEFAMNHLPGGDQKDHALSDALIFWAGNDPVAAAAWINGFQPTPELDQGEAAIATRPDVMQQPALAVNWAKTITDPNLRSRTLAAIVETWSLTSPVEAFDFVKTSIDLTPDDRDGLLSKFSPPAN